MIDKRLLGELGQEKKYLVYISVLKIFSLILNILMVFKISKYVEQLLIGGGNLVFMATLLLLIVLMQVIIIRMESYLSHKLSVAVKSKFRGKLFEKVYGFGLGYSQKVHPAEMVQLSVEGIEQLDMYYGKFLPQLIYSIISPVILFIVLAPINLKISILLFIAVPLIPVAIVFIQKLAKKVMKNYWGSYVNLSEVFLDFLKGMTTLKIYNADEAQNMELNKLAEDFRINTMKVLSVQLNNITVMDLIAYGGTAAGIISTIFLYSKAELALSAAIIFVLISAEFFLPLRLLGSFFHVAMNGMASAEKIFQVLEIENTYKGSQSLEEERVYIEINNLDFSYNEDRKILKKLYMKFEPGKIVAIVGQSGCGKSTIAALLMGNLKAQHGKITFNEKDDILESHRLEKLTSVDNNPYLFRGTLRYNLLIANPKASDAQLWEVLDQLSLKEYFQEEMGLDTYIEEQGSNLSGGQKQRISLARALLKDSNVFIFDEATSNIDSESEDIIMSLVERLKKNKTIVLISHRMKNTEKSDYIYYMEDGKVAEEGKFKTLLEDGGKFKQLYENQKRLEEWGYVNG